MGDANLDKALWATAHALADLARPIALHYFRTTGIGTTNKEADGFDPVTLADREIEAAMRDYLAKHRPDDGILGEEFAPKPSTSGLTWVLDPIDGTRGFISGAPTWGVLIAVNAGDGPILGVIDQPFTQERYCGGLGQAVWQNDVIGPRALKTRETTALADAMIFSTYPEVGTPADRRAFEAVAQKCLLTRFGTDCYAYALLALGQIDLVIEAGLNAYDIQAPIAVIEAAGGIVTDWTGAPAHDGGAALAAANPAIHAKALEILKSTVAG